MVSRTVVWGLGLSALTVALVCVAAELWFRRDFARSQRLLQEKHQGRDLCTKPSEHAELIYTYVPNACDSNSQGYPDIERSFEKPAGTLRIALIGDSIAAGTRVDRSSRFPSVLEQRLAEDHPGAEVVVLARTGYSTSQELFVLRRDVARYDPDVLVWSYALNDPAHPYFHNANGELGTYYVRPRVHLIHAVRRFLFLASQRARGRGCPDEFHAFLHCAFWDDVDASIDELAEFGREHKVTILFVIHPVFEENRGFHEYSLRSVHERLSETAMANGLHVLDLLEAYSDYPPDELRQTELSWFDPWHPNVLGHEVAGRSLHEALIEKGLLDGFGPEPVLSPGR